MIDEEYMQTLRDRMVRQQLEARGISDQRVLDAMRRVPRHLFVPESLLDRAYDDCPLPIGEGQTISQPYMVAWMTELLQVEPGQKVLEIGTGSGYQAAILCELGADVFTIEKNPLLAREAERRLAELGYFPHIRIGDGTLGWPEEAPFQRIIVTAGAPSIPGPLLEQLDEGGRLVIPVGPSGMQMLTLVERKEGKLVTVEEGTCVFVPLVGKYGWKEGERGRHF
ncbi:MAG: protein-L-isoaspartate(D-aspartate) O-methyltransferase [Candidatus Geothermincolales bacterium]